MSLLTQVVTTAFIQVEPSHSSTGLLQPGQQLQQLLYNIAAQLTAIIVGVAPAPPVMPFFEASAAAQVPGEPTAGTAVEGPSSSNSHSSCSSPTSADAHHTLLQQQQQHHHHHHHWHQQHHGSQQASRRSSFQNQNLHLPQQQQHTLHGQEANHISNDAAPSPRADVVIMDGTGGCVHYTTSVSEAAAAAATGRLPRTSSGVHVYQQGAGAGQQHLSPGELN